MGNKYVSLVGNDANNGLGPNAADSTNKPWGTLEYAVDNMSDGDVLHVAPGIWRDVITIGVTPTVETIIRGDPLNLVGFKDGSGNLLTPGPVIVTNLLTDDVSAANNTAPVIDCNGKNYLTFENLWIESYSQQSCLLVPATSTNVTVRHCFIITHIGASAISVTVAADTTASHLIERCIVVSNSGNCIAVTLTKTNTADYDSGTTIRNCTIIAGSNYACLISTTATATYFGGGVALQNCSIFSGAAGLRTGAGFNAAITHKLSIKNCWIEAISCIAQPSGVAGDVCIEDFNFLVGTTPRTNVNAGSNTIAYATNSFNRSIRHDFGQSQLWGFLAKSFMAPWSTSRTIGFGNDSTPTALTVDIWNRPRPSGSGVAAASVLNSVGAHELHEYGTKDTAVKDASDASLKLVGPGDHEFIIPVGAAATLISIKVRYDTATYDPTNKPRAILFDSEGFAAISGNIETLTASVSAADAWETLTFTTFTPTRKGVVRLRLVNRGTGADDVCWFDTMTIS